VRILAPLTAGRILNRTDIEKHSAKFARRLRRLELHHLGGTRRLDNQIPKRSVRSDNFSQPSFDLLIRRNSFDPKEFAIIAARLLYCLPQLVAGDLNLRN
jgi:hypothetical protein